MAENTMRNYRADNRQMMENLGRIRIAINLFQDKNGTTKRFLSVIFVRKRWIAPPGIAIKSDGISLFYRSFLIFVYSSSADDCPRMRLNR